MQGCIQEIDHVGSPNRCAQAPAGEGTVPLLARRAKGVIEFRSAGRTQSRKGAASNSLGPVLKSFFACNTNTGARAFCAAATIRLRSSGLANDIAPGANGRKARRPCPFSAVISVWMPP